MKLILSHSSALDFIRASRWRKGSLPASNVVSLADCACSLTDIERIFFPAFEQSEPRLEVLVASDSKKQKSREHVCRVLRAQPIKGMFCKIGRNAYITSPEMTFVQMASRLSLIELVILGMEPCGTYARSPYGNSFGERPAVTSKCKLLAFCKRASGVRSSSTAMKALRWVVDGSNSPAETSLVLLLCLPVHLGGYRFEYPEMNPITALGKRSSTMLGHHSMRCDLHWVERRVVVEYDSDQEHLTSQSASKDASRRNVLGYNDVAIITVRKPMIADSSKFDDIARQLSRALGRRLRARDLEPTQARSDLRSALFPWLRYGLSRNER